MTMTRRALFILAVAFGATSTQAWADKNPKGLNDDIKRQDGEIAKARQKLTAARKESDSARQALQKVQAALEKATDKAADVRRSVHDQHDAAGPLVEARKRAEAARAELQRASQPVLDRLQAQPEYQTAVANRDRSKRQLAALPAAAAPQERAGIEKEYTESTAAVRRLDKAAIDADPAAKAARAAVDASEATVRELVRKRDQAIDQDARLKSAKSELDRAKSELAQAKNKLEGEMRQLAAAQKSVTAEEQQKRALEQKRQQQNKKKK